MGSRKWESTTLDTCFKKLLTINEYELHICLGIVWDQHFQPVNLPNSQLLQPWESQNPVDLKIFITKTLVRVHNLKISPQLTPQKLSTCSVETLGIFSIFGNQNKAMLSPSQLFVLKKVCFHSFFGIAWLRFTIWNLTKAKRIDPCGNLFLEPFGPTPRPTVWHHLLAKKTFPQPPAPKTLEKTPHWSEGTGAFKSEHDTKQQICWCRNTPS